MKKCLLSLLAFLCAFILALSPLATKAHAAEFTDTVNAKSAIVMEASSGAVLYEYNADEPLPPASVTKIMTILLVLEAIDEKKIAITDTVTVSDYASSMGGSQVYLKAGEEMSVDDLLKSVVVASANDAAVALAEYVAGSEGTFVSMMNTRAAELGMKNTVFKNTNGLDDSDMGHVTSARDIAIMSREVLRHELIFKYSTIWMDSIRGGEFGLTNTNRLVRFYRGCNGLKTGSTSKAGFCISATAKRDDMQLICVTMAAPTKDARNALTAALLDWGFASYTCAKMDAGTYEHYTVTGGKEDSCTLTYDAASFVVAKGDAGRIQAEVTLGESLTAPIKEGEAVGEIKYTLDGEVLGSVEICAKETVEEIGYFTLFLRMLSVFLGGHF